uniref:Uncharacterized protein n=1 Tax=Chromera velia CCMP2878 TaxID=1169474 RepID=A0A0G4HW77_9ALVE|eukprot:Cvel_32567.t1-p1 / transcript=Cvel_32567.t1 / gene=Cvel_32567 / organism=Chromera_velia_CCMP2878 / gene_product=hypothetical protein / transcript_product=hypothetical protein / location=Cvel_scaffold5096:318-2599(-) / protein_length=383 / sequence_SO=supercontig / SO=protein_coding / is_pseudo=false
MHTYVSMSVRMRDGEMLPDQSVYIMNMAESVSPEAKKPIIDKDLLLLTEKDVDPSLQKEQQRNVEALGWAVCTQPSLSFLFSHLSGWNTRPSPASVLATKKALWHVKVTAKPLKLKKVRGVPVLVVWVDVSYQLSLREGRLGWEMQILNQEEVGDLERVSEDNTVVWASKKCIRKLRSTTIIELFAMCDGVKFSFIMFNLIKKLWGVFPKVLVVSDSQPLMNQLTSRQCKSKPHQQAELEYVLQELADLGATVKWVPTGEAKADTGSDAGTASIGGDDETVVDVDSGASGRTAREAAASSSAAAASAPAATTRTFRRRRRLAEVDSDDGADPNFEPSSVATPEARKRKAPRRFRKNKACEGGNCVYERTMNCPRCGLNFDVEI